MHLAKEKLQHLNSIAQEGGDRLVLDGMTKEPSDRGTAAEEIVPLPEETLMDSLSDATSIEEKIGLGLSNLQQLEDLESKLEQQRRKLSAEIEWLENIDEIIKQRDEQQNLIEELKEEEKLLLSNYQKELNNPLNYWCYIKNKETGQYWCRYQSRPFVMIVDKDETVDDAEEPKYYKWGLTEVAEGLFYIENKDVGDSVYINIFFDTRSLEGKHWNFQPKTLNFDNFFYISTPRPNGQIEQLGQGDNMLGCDWYSSIVEEARYSWKLEKSDSNQGTKIDSANKNWEGVKSKLESAQKKFNQLNSLDNLSRNQVLDKLQLKRDEFTLCENNLETVRTQIDHVKSNLSSS